MQAEASTLAALGREKHARKMEEFQYKRQKLEHAAQKENHQREREREQHELRMLQLRLQFQTQGRSSNRTASAFGNGQFANNATHDFSGGMAFPSFDMDFDAANFNFQLPGSNEN
jgi:phosphopantetheinyl transferase